MFRMEKENIHKLLLEGLVDEAVSEVIGLNEESRNNIITYESELYLKMLNSECGEHTLKVLTYIPDFFKNYIIALKRESGKKNLSVKNTELFTTLIDKLYNLKWWGVKWTNDPSQNNDIYSRMLRIAALYVEPAEDKERILKSNEERIKEIATRGILSEYTIYKKPSLLLALKLTYDKDFHQKAVNQFKIVGGDTSMLSVLIKKEFPYIKI